MHRLFRSLVLAPARIFEYDRQPSGYQNYMRTTAAPDPEAPEHRGG